jgi:hypothetical protein
MSYFDDILWSENDKITYMIWFISKTAWIN